MKNKKPLRIYVPVSKEYSLFENKDDFIKFKVMNDLEFHQGFLKDLGILERKPNSNKGNALEGVINPIRSGLSLPFNMGGNPIGTGWEQYIPFLEESGCQKVDGLYNLKSLDGRWMSYLYSRDFLIGRFGGIIVPESLDKFLE